MDFISPWIHTTNRCNLKCHYCYVNGNEIMEENIYETLENFLLNTDTKKRHLRFAGGEPLLVFDKWESFAKRMLEHDGSTVEVLTNFIDVPEKFWEFAKLKNVNVSISIDNGNTIKTLNKDIIKKVERLENPWILTTLTTENLQKLDTLAAFIGKNNYGWCITTDYFEKYVPTWTYLSIIILGILETLQKYNYDFSKISFNNCTIKGNFSGCRAGNEMITIAPNGKIYACQTLIGKNSIGDIWKGYTKKEITQRDTCKSCTISSICSGWCPIHFKPNSLCNVIKIFANEILGETYAKRLSM